MSLANALTDIVATGMLKLLSTIVVSEYRCSPTMPAAAGQQPPFLGKEFDSCLRGI